MTATSKTVIFFGSGPVAAESLRLLLNHQPVEAIITKPATSKVMQQIAGPIPVHAVSSQSELDDLITGQQFSSDLGILIDFGIMVSQQVIDSFTRGIINSHFSLLPELRGADPITFSILSGQKLTGVSLMILVQAMDEGPIIAVGEQPIGKRSTTPELTQQLIALSDSLLVQAIPNFRENKWKPVDQSNPTICNNRKPSYSRRLAKADGELDFTKAAVQLDREIRAYLDWPKSHTVIAGKDVIITAAHTVDENGQPGHVGIIDKQLVVYCGQQALIIDGIKPAGKPVMTGTAFLAGYKQRL